jgi:DNA-binding LacI/PurR family transcriptional regulator
MAKKVKLADIAAVLNVSTVTVSKALSDQKGVSEEMREKIKNLADQLGYKQPSALKSFINKESHNIGIIVPGRYFGKYVSFYWQLYQEVTTKAVQKDCFSMLEVISPEDETNLVLPKLIREKKVEGIILIGRPNSEYIQKLREDGEIPLVCLDFFDYSSNCDAVISDGFYGTYLLTNYLFDMGHEDIIYVGTLLYTNSITDRYLGYYKSMMEHGKKASEIRAINDRNWETGDVINYQFDFPDGMPTAFVCNCDLAANTLIKAIREKGYRVPEDISVVGFDNYLHPGLSVIGITTYDVNLKEMARNSINVLLKKMNKEIYKSGVKIVEGNIVYKDSVAPRIKSD